MIKVGVKK